MRQIVCLLAALGFLLAGWTANENITVVGPRPFTSPWKLFMGPTEDAGLYIYAQQRQDGQVWSGVETFKRPDAGQVSAGYGAWPLRLWGTNFLAEENGVVVAPELVTERIILQRPDNRGPGGVTWDRQRLGTYFAWTPDCVLLYVNGHEAQRWC